MTPLQRLLAIGVGLLVALSPLPFGAVQPEATAALVCVTAALGALWMVERARRGRPPLPWSDPLLLAGALFALFAAAQTVALPPAALAAISPRAAALRAAYEPGASVAPAASAWRPLSLNPFATRQAAARFIACLVAALITIELCGRKTTRRLLASALVAGGVFQAIYGLAEFFSGRQQIFGYAKKYYTDVATGTFINRNHFAGYLAMTLPMAIALAASVLDPQGTAGRTSSGDRVPLGERLARSSGRRLFAATGLLLLALAMATALVCSGSRMGIASALLALLAVGLPALVRGRGRGFAVAVLLVAGGTLVLISQGDAADAILGRFALSAQEVSGAMGRRSIWAQAAAMAASFPLAGAGLGTFRDVFPLFRTAGAASFLDHAHNDYLELFAETGALGCAVAATGLLLVALPLLKRPGARADFGPLGPAAAAGLAAILIHSLTDFNLAIPSNAMTCAVLAGFVIAWLRIPAPALADAVLRPRPRLARAWLPAGGLAAITLVPLAPFGGGDARRFFALAEERGKPAMDDLQVLVRTQTESHDGRAAARYVERRLREAIEAQEEGLKRLPIAARAQLELGRLALARCGAAALADDETPACVTRAVEPFYAAARLDPMSASTHDLVSRALLGAWPILAADERDRARPIIDWAVRINQGDAELRALWKTQGGS